MRVGNFKAVFSFARMCLQRYGFCQSDWHGDTKCILQQWEAGIAGNILNAISRHQHAESLPSGIVPFGSLARQLETPRSCPAAKPSPAPLRRLGRFEAKRLQREQRGADRRERQGTRSPADDQEDQRARAPSPRWSQSGAQAHLHRPAAKREPAERRNRLPPKGLPQRQPSKRAPVGLGLANPAVDSGAPARFPQARQRSHAAG